MNGIAAAFTGRLGKDAELRTTRDGKPWAAFPVAVDTTKGQRGRHVVGKGVAFRR